MNVSIQMKAATKRTIINLIDDAMFNADNESCEAIVRISDPCIMSFIYNRSTETVEIHDITGLVEECMYDEFKDYIQVWDPSTPWARSTATSASGRLNFSSAHPSTNWTNISSPNYNGQDLQDAMVILTDAIVDATVPRVGIQHNTVDLGPRLGSFCFVVDMNGQIEFEGSNIRYHAHEVMDLINHRPNDLLQEMIAARNVGNKTVVPAFKREFDASQDSKGHVCEPGMTKIFGKDICKHCGIDFE